MASVVRPLAAGLTAAAVTGPILRRLPWSWPVLGAPAAFAAHLTALSVPAAGAAIAARRPRLALAAAGVAGIGAATYAPLFRAAPVPSGAPLRVMSANCLLGRADPQDVVRLARAHRVDVLLLVEAPPPLCTALHAAGLDDLLPHCETWSGPRLAGVGVWSTQPLTERVELPGMRFVSARLANGVRAAAVHIPAPWPFDHGWARDLARLDRWLQQQDGAVLVGGDYNATIDNRPFRRLLRAGVADAAAQAGAGYPSSFPDDGRPAVIAIDHVLTRAAVATQARTLHVRGTDHRALLVDLVVPRQER